MPALQPASTAAVAVLGSPHPLDVHGLRGVRSLSPAATRTIARAQVPMHPEHAIQPEQ